MKIRQRPAVVVGLAMALWVAAPVPMLASQGPGAPRFPSGPRCENPPRVWCVTWNGVTYCLRRLGCK